MNPFYEVEKCMFASILTDLKQKFQVFSKINDV